MSSLPNDQPLDILAIAAHRDDVEQTCGGTLLKAAQRGQRTPATLPEGAPEGQAAGFSL